MRYLSALYVGYFAIVMSITSIGNAHAMPDSFADLATRLTPAVVNIATSHTVAARNAPNFQPPFDEFFEEFFGQRRDQSRNPSKRKVSSLGSGFIIDPSGIIITNNHVIEKADEITVKLSDKREYPARILGRDPKTDLAVLKVDASKPLPYVPLGASSEARVGDWVIAIGNPFGLGGSLSAGVISAINRDIQSGPYDSFIQTDAAINRGNSGGPLFNMQGEVIGVNSAIISPSGGSVGIGFSIPADLVKSVVAQLRTYGETRRGWLGVRIQQVTKELAENLELDDTSGALISEVSPDGPAAKGGVKAGDVIIRFDGQEVAQMRDLPRIVAGTDIDKRVAIEVVRRGDRLTLQITTGRLEEEALPDTKTDNEADEDKNNVKVLGLSLRNLDAALRKSLGMAEGVKGVLITNVDAESVAAESRFVRGDVILEIDRQKMGRVNDVENAIRRAQDDGKASVLALLSSRNGLRFVALRLEN